MRLKKYACIVAFFVGVALFAFSLMDFFRNVTANFWIMTIVGLVTIVLSLLIGFYKPKEKVKLTSKYERKPTLISRAEYEFLQTLKQVAGNSYEVVPQVSLVSVIDKRTNTQYRNELFRVCDYCFVDKDTYEPLLLIELNDNSHKRADRVERDEKVAAICKSAGMPLLTFWLNDDLSYATVKRAVKRSILK